MPAQVPGSSKQDVATDRRLIAAIEHRFGRIEVDLAAHKRNAVCERFVSRREDSLSFSWAERFPGRRMFLNPEYDDITPWARKCHAENSALWVTGAKVLMLVPASTGSEWFAKYLFTRAEVHLLRGRLTFRGHTQSYPKDCLLAIFGMYTNGGLVQVWDWRKDVHGLAEDAA